MTQTTTHPDIARSIRMIQIDTILFAASLALLAGCKQEASSPAMAALRSRTAKAAMTAPWKSSRKQTLNT